MEQPVLNAHNKEEYPPMHTAEHILNATMVKMFGCRRSNNAHIERKKSKCDYMLEREPSPEQIAEIERRVNEVIAANMPVSIEFVSKQEAAAIVDLSKLPEDASETLRIVRIGNYDACACIGAHVATTGEIAPFKIISADFTAPQESNGQGRWRVRFRLLE